ncbi:hypothetical protein [Saccharothrix lopnurensis]|uniref:VapC45 PIN like domain-containing protein n=1 Tax=Saccharothrix lopnurensis TaxID=1670621 RepID=A0ABW1P9W7_9PSEU
MSRPEFFLDRGLGRGVADGLRELDWSVHRITDHFPDDAQCVADEEWLAYGLERGWVPLCKDGRIKGRNHEREPLVVHSAVLFYLNNQQLRRDQMVDRFRCSRPAIDRAVERGGPAVYAIGESGIRRTWP